MINLLNLISNLNNPGYTLNFEQNVVKRPFKLCDKVIEMRIKIDKLNKLTGVIFLVKFMSNSAEISGCICAMAVGRMDLTSTISLFGFLCVSVMDIVVSCRSSQLIINAMNNLCHTLENYLSLNGFNEDDYRQLKLTISMKDSFKYQVLNLFDLKDLTILSITGYIANYAVILIQTQ